MTEHGAPGDDDRRAVGYLVAPESTQYIAIMNVLDESVTDLSPAEVATSLHAHDVPLSQDTVQERLDKLREWGVVTPRVDTSAAQRYSDLLARHWRWSATTVGRRVHRFYSTSLAGNRTAREIPIASLQRIISTLADLESIDLTDPGTHAHVAELTGRLFTAHDDLDSALVGAEDTLTTLAERFDLDPTAAAELKGLLVSYATRLCSELLSGSTMAHQTLTALTGSFDALARITVTTSDAQELIARGALTASRGGRPQDWSGLASWCDPNSGRARMFALRLLRALPAMHANLRRLHATTGQSTIRSRALALARAAADPNFGTQVFHAALGDHPWRKLHGETDDTDLGQTPTWRDGPQVPIPAMLRATGRTGARGRISPARDHTAAAAEVQARREERARARAAAVEEVLTTPDDLSPAGARAALDVLMAAVRNVPDRRHRDRRTATVDGLACTLFHCPGQTGRIASATWTVTVTDRVPVFHPPGVTVTPPAPTAVDSTAPALACDQGAA